jgi:hypothetical protein
MGFRTLVVIFVQLILSSIACCAETDINAKVAKLDIGRSTIEDVIRIFGQPSQYVWGKETFKRSKLPERYLADYKGNIQVMLIQKKVCEIRFENLDMGYRYLGKIGLGSSLEEAINVIGPPKQIITGAARAKTSQDGVLYKDMDGRPGRSFYSRPDKGIRCHFADNQISGIYITANIPYARPASQSPPPSAPEETKNKAGEPVKPASKLKIITTKQAGPVEWKDNKIVSRVLPYPDLTSLFIRLPIAHAAVDGNGVKVAVVGLSNEADVKNDIEPIAPAALVSIHHFSPTSMYPSQIAQRVIKGENQIAVIADADKWNSKPITELSKELQDANILVIIPSDLSENEKNIEIINSLQSMGVLTVGRVNRQSMTMQGQDNKQKPFNSKIRDIKTDVFSTIGLESEGNPVAAVAGVAALVFEKWPQLSPQEVKGKIITGARNVWQATSAETGQMNNFYFIDSVTTKYTPINESAIFRFCVLDAAGAVGVDTEMPWFLNMLNIGKAWEITKGQGIVAVVSDQGFHIKHPALIDRITGTEHFGPKTLDDTIQEFHGTDMSRILLSVAPQCKIIPVLCSASSNKQEELAENIAKSFDYAVEHKADVISASWAGYFSDNNQILNAAQKAVDKGIVVSWFHYPKAYPGLLRSRFTYNGWGDIQCIGFADRFLTDEPGFHPVEIEAGLSGTAPQAAGLAVLVKSVNSQLTPPEIQKLIFDNSTPIGNNILIPDAYKTVVAAKQMIKNVD